MMRPYLPGGIPPRYAACHDPVTIGIVLGGIALGGVGLSAASMFLNRPQQPRMPQQNVPQLQDPAVQAAALAQQRAAQEAKGRGSTILTGGMGEDNSTLQSAKKATLGA